jgi:type IV secretion system protein VirD4
MRFTDLPRGLPQSPSDSGTAPRALWLNPQTLIDSDFWQFGAGKLFLGAWGEHLLGIDDNRHLLTVAGSRAGKGTSVIIPNLLTYEGSVLVLDPKGENASLTAERRGKGRGIKRGGLGHEVYVIDPFKIADVNEEYRAGFNPFDFLDPKSPNFIDDCDSLADALIVAEPSKTNDHWNSSARLTLRGFIAWVAIDDDPKKRSLNELKRLLYLPPEMEDGAGLDDVLADMIEAPEIAYGIPADTAGMLLGMGQDERGSVFSTVRQNIAFLSSPPMAECLASGQRTIDLEKWKFGGKSVYLCLPAGRLHRHNRFFRLFVNLLLSAIERDKRQPDLPAIMILDEMHVLGHMSALETGVGLLAGYGVRIWSIWQDLSQLKHLYRERWETFMGNAGILQFFGLNDLTTLEYVSKRLGESSMLRLSQSEISTQQSVQGFSGESRSIQNTKLLTPDEVAYFFSRQSNNQLVLYAGADPIFMERVPYYSDKFKEFIAQ